jgi:Uma2 family endonuclease
MVQPIGTKLTVEEFFALPEGRGRYELIDGEAVPKVSPKRFHAGTQKALLMLLNDWAQQHGHFYPEWATVLKRRGEDWVPVPDLTYISYVRLAQDWQEDAACPMPPDLAIEIISPDQSFGEMAEKATDYLTAGVPRVWVVDPRARSITVFYPDAAPRTYTHDMVVTDALFEGLELTVQQVFAHANVVL